MNCNLHIHTTASDGALSPEEVVLKEKGKGFDALAITDHDTVNGVARAAETAKAEKVRFVSGIELSSYSESIGEVHILGYRVPYTDAGFLDELVTVRSKRKERNYIIVSKLKDMGMDLSGTGLNLENDNLGRYHIAQAMVAAGYCKTVNDAFDFYIGNGKPAHSPGRRLTPLEAVKLIKGYGGVPVLAHPAKILNKKMLEPLVTGLKRYGLEGLECHYATHNETETAELVKLADRIGLIKTAGTDYHNDDSSYLSPSFRGDLLDAKSLSRLGLK